MFKKVSLIAVGFVVSLLPLAGCGNPSTAGSVPGLTPLSIATTALPSASVGTAYSATIAATGGTPPYTFSYVSGVIPGGLTLTKAGSLSGTPTGAGTFTFTIAAVDYASTRATATYTIPVIAPLAITTTTLAGGTVGTAYSATVAAIGGTTPYTFAVVSGTLPAGLSFNATTGAVTGTPTAPGPSSFSVKVTDKGSLTATQAYSVTIAAQPAITLSPTTLPAGTLKVAYTATTFTAINGTAPYAYTISAGALPGGLTLTPAGVLSGTPTASGTFNCTVTATDATARTGSAAYSLVIAAGPTIVIAPVTLPAAAASSAFSAKLSATGGTAPYTFTVPLTSLPNGLKLDADGTLHGTPTTSGTYSFTVTATDANTYTGTQAFTLTVNTVGSILTLGSNNLGALVNKAYTYTLPFSGGTGTYTVTKTGGSFPSGVSLSSAGVFSGIPTATGTSTFTVHVTDTSTPQLSQDFTITLNVVDATVAVDTTTALATVPSIFYGLHTAVYDNQLTDYAAISSRMASAGVTMLRYPGGGLSDVYHWAQHSVTPYEASYPATCNDLAVPYISSTAHFGNFVKLLQASGAGAIITVNYGNSVADANASRTTGYGGTGIAYNFCSNPNKPGQPQEAAAWVAYANGSTTNTLSIGKDDAGFDWKTVSFWATLRSASPLGADDGYNFLRINHPDPIGIKYWEVGNEVYYNGWSNNQNAETDTHAPYLYNSTQYKYQDYQSRAGVSALSPTAYGINAVSFINAMKAVDSSIKVGLAYDAPGATDPISASYNPDLTASACSHGAFDFVIIHYYPGTYFGGAKPQELLSLPQYDLPKQINGDASDPTHPGIRPLLNASCANSSSIQYFMTETSPNQSLAPGFPPPVIGLFVINEMMMSLQVGYQNFDWLELHSSTTQANYMQNTFLDSSETPGPSYYGIQMAHVLATPGDTQVPAVATNTSSTGFIVSYAMRKPDGTPKGIVLMNADPTLSETVQVTFSGASLSSSATQYSYGINTTQNNNALTQTTFTIPGQSFPVTVPPFTAVELIIQ